MNAPTLQEKEGKLSQGWEDLVYETLFKSKARRCQIDITPNYHPFNLCTGGFGDKKVHKCVMRKYWHGYWV